MEKIDQLPDFVRPALLGMASAELCAGEAVNELTQAQFTTNAVKLQGRWGHLPANAAHDPSIEALDHPSWILDLDAYTAGDALRRALEVPAPRGPTGASAAEVPIHAVWRALLLQKCPFVQFDWVA